MRPLAGLLVMALGCSSSSSERSPLIASQPQPQPGDEEIDVEPVPALTVASYNINAARAGDPDTLEALRALDADIVFIQEVSRAWLPSLRDAAAGYPHVEWSPFREKWGGLGVISRLPIRDAELLAPEHGAFPAWRGIVQTPLGPVQVLNVHLHPPTRLARRSGWIQAYRDSQTIHLAEMQGFYRALDHGVPALVVGDLNEDALGKAVKWLGERGFEGAVPAGEPTWRWQTRLGMIRWQLDHILYRGPWRVRAPRVHDAGGSDHVPIAATLEPSKP